MGQRTAVAVAKNRYGPPGRSVDLDIHYLAEGERAVATHRLASDGDVEDADSAPAPGSDSAPAPGSEPVAQGWDRPRLVVA